MKAQIVSDIHTEFIRPRGGEKAVRDLFSGLVYKDVDIHIVAGDLSSSEYLIDDLTLLKEYCGKLIYVPGNHDYYGSTFEEVDDKLNNLSVDGLHVLNRKCVTIDGVTFAGTTGWFPDGMYVKEYKHWLNDFFKIGDASIESIAARNEADSKFLLGNVGKETVVITHHLPTYSCVSSQYVEYKTNCFFVSGFMDVIDQCSPRLWIHGHSHIPNSMFINDTTIRAKPFGYWMIETSDIPYPCIVEIQ